MVSGNVADVLYYKYGSRMIDRAKEIEMDMRGIQMQTTDLYKQHTSE